MYYSYKEIVTTGPQGTVKTFRPNYTYEFSGSEEENEQKREELEQLKSECQYLGEADGLHYYYVPDSYPLAEQNAEINAQQLETLDPTVRAKVILSPDSPVQSSDYIMSIDKLPYPVNNANEQGNLAYLLTIIRGLAYKLNAILEQMPVTLSTEVTSSVMATNIVKELVNQEVEKQAGLVYLTDIEVGRRNKLKQLSLYSAKYEENVNSNMFFTSSIGYRINGDRRSLTNISSLIEYFDVKQQNGTIDFKDYDNQMRKLTKEQLQTIKAELITNSENLYSQKWTLETRINEAASIDELNAIKIEFTMMDFTPKTQEQNSNEDLAKTIASLFS